MYEHKEIKRLQDIKIKINNKENKIIKSQKKEHKLENKIKKLEYKKKRILSRKKSIIKRIISYLIYDLIIISILIIFVSKAIGVLDIVSIIPNSIYVLSIYIGVILISILGAIISSKIETILKKYFTKRKIISIRKKIQNIKSEIEQEKNKQQTLKQEITDKIKFIENPVPEKLIDRSIDEINYKYNNFNNEFSNNYPKFNKKIRIKKLVKDKF